MNRYKIIQALIGLLLPLALWGQVSTQHYVEISKETYYDKTLACIIGHIGGFLSGFEFVNLEGQTQVPYVGLPDEWFSMCYGPYGGGPKHGSAGENCVIANGQIRQDDDYHVDFFNQLIFEKSEHIPTALDISRWWKYHQVRDWGGGLKAMEIMNKKDFVPPFTGQLEYGNVYSWCTEPYIENETVGCVAPGMAQTAAMLTDRFSAVTGEYESVVWARFFGAMYAIAYFETSAVEAMKKAALLLPQWSQAKFIYEKALELHRQYPDDWRKAARTLTQYKRHIYRLDNVHVAYDMNCGFTVLAILYGDNDYYKSIKTAALMGYDGDCTAATVGGLMGIIKGMAGTHPKVKEVVYNHGNGELVNDGKYEPFIRRHYPMRQKFTELAALYQRNTEKVIAAMRGEISESSYRIPVEEVKPGTSVVIPNRDFESEHIGVEKALLNGAQGGIDKSKSFSPHSGDGTARILTRRAGAEGKVFVRTENLEVGRSYKIGGYLVAKGENRASLFVRNGAQWLTSSVFDNASDWYCRTIRFTAVETAADIGLYVPPVIDGLFNAYLDDITIEECNQQTLAGCEAETLTEHSSLFQIVDDASANASAGRYMRMDKGGKLKGISVVAPQTGAYTLRVRFMNNSGSVVTARVMSGDEFQAKFPFFVTGRQPVFEENVVEVPLSLHSGANVLSLEQFSGEVALDKIEIVSDSSFYLRPKQPLSYETLRNETQSVDAFEDGAGNLVIRQKEGAYTRAALYTISGTLVQRFTLTGTDEVQPLTRLVKGAYVVVFSGDAPPKTVKLFHRN